MYLDRLLNQGSSPLLEQWLRFSDARQHLLAEDVANISTPDFRQKDLSVEKFQSMLAQRLEQREQSGPGEVPFDDISMDVQNPARGVLFHDGSNRSIDQLMSDQAKNALMHSMAVELLRQQYNTLDMALKERLS
jgi:flagellar basal-body rod protein FlgB